MAPFLLRFVQKVKIIENTCINLCLRAKNIIGKQKKFCKGDVIMSNKFKDSKFYQKMCSLRISRSALVTVVTVIIVASAIIAITVAANRANKDKFPDDTLTDTGSATTPDTSDTNAGSASADPDKEPSIDVSDKIPTFTLPATGVLSSKHDPEVQVYSTTMKDYRVHLGIDINTTEGAPVYAAADGKVEKVWEDVLMGYCVAVSHSGDACTIYKNLAKTLADGIEKGASVKEGQLVGAVGDSAMVEIAHEPHLHFEMTVAGVEVDPLKYFSENAVATLTSGDSTYEK